MIRWRKTAAVPTALGLALCAALTGGGPVAGRLVARPTRRRPAPSSTTSPSRSAASSSRCRRRRCRAALCRRPTCAPLLAGGDPWPDRLRRLDARAIVMPVLRVEQATDQGVQVAVYRDVIARDVVRAASAGSTPPGPC